VTVDLTPGMLRQLDERTARLNISRQAVIKALLSLAMENAPRSRDRQEGGLTGQCHTGYEASHPDCSYRAQWEVCQTRNPGGRTRLAPEILFC